MKLCSFSFVAFFVYIATQLSSTAEDSVSCDERSDDFKLCGMDGDFGYCYKEECLTLSTTTRKPVLLKVRYNTSNEYMTSNYRTPSMWLRGNAMGLSWAHGKRMEKIEKDTWQFLVNISIPLNKDKPRLEFRVYLNNTRDMLGANFVITLPPSTSTKYSSDLNAPSLFWVYPWFFNKRGKVIKRFIYSPQLRQKRNITIYTPASFNENHYKMYETLFFNDGQRVEHLIPQIDILTVHHALLKEIVVVGIVNDFSERVRLLAPTNGSSLHCKTGNYSNNCNNCLQCTDETHDCNYKQIIVDYQCYDWLPLNDVYGQLYLDFIEQNLIPETQKAYRALPGGENVGITGFSFSGLLSCHAMWTRPHVFGSAACMSSSFWWPFPVGNHTFPDDTEYEFVNKTLHEHREMRPRQKVYIDVGSTEGGIMVDPSRNASRILASTPYFELDKNLWFYIWKGEKHNFVLSQRRIWVALLALYGAEGAAQPTTAMLQPSTTRITNAANHITVQHFYLLYIIVTLMKFVF